MKITSTTEVDKHEWDKIAVSVGGSYFHCHAHAVYSAACENAEPLFLQAWNDQEQCIGITTGIIARSQLWPFSKYCNWAMLQTTPVASDDSAETETAMMEALETHLKQQGVFSIHVYSYDSPHSENVLSSCGYNMSQRTEFYLDMNDSPDEIWSNFKPQRKQKIRKAEKSGVVTRRENTVEALDTVFSLQVESMQRRNISMAQTEERITRARRTLLESGRIDVFVSTLNNEPINGSVFGNFNDKPYYLVSGSSDLGFKNCGPVHLIWTAIQRYKERGATSLNLGATLADQDSLYQFKKDFGATPVSQPIGKKRISQVGSSLHRIRSLLGK